MHLFAYAEKAGVGPHLPNGTLAPRRMPLRGAFLLMCGRFGCDSLVATVTRNEVLFARLCEISTAGDSRFVPDVNGAHCPISLEIMIELVNIADSLDFSTNFARNRVVNEYGYSQNVCPVLPW